MTETTREEELTDVPVNPLALAHRVAKCANIHSIRVKEGMFGTELLEDEIGNDITLSCEWHPDADQLRVDISVQIRHQVQPESREHLHARAVYCLEYKIQEDAPEFSEEETAAFAKINGTYNFWPFWREFLQGIVQRMELPIGPLPLLTAAEAVRLAGYSQDSEEKQE